MKKYFDSEFYGWCDIGYFRNRHNDTSKEMLCNWPEHSKIGELNKDKIHYGLINNNSNYMNQLFKLIIDKNEMGLPKIPIPPNQLSVAAGFFILHKDNIQWWVDTYDAKLKLYFNNLGGRSNGYCNFAQREGRKCCKNGKYRLVGC